MVTFLGKRGGPIGGARLAWKLVETVVRRRPLTVDLEVIGDPDVLHARIAELHRAGTFHIRMTGDPLGHPDLVALVGHASCNARVSIAHRGLALTAGRA